MPHRTYYLSSRKGGVVSCSARSNKLNKFQKRDKLKNGKLWNQERLDYIAEDNREEETRLMWIEEEKWERKYELPMLDQLYRLCYPNN